MKESKYTLKFKTNGEYTFTTEGICVHKKCDYTITIPMKYFEKHKTKPDNKLINVAGHLCKDQLECLQRVMEHELTHLVIFMFCDDPFITDQHGPLFMRMISDLWRHTDHRHHL